LDKLIDVDKLGFAVVVVDDSVGPPVGFVLILFESTASIGPDSVSLSLGISNAVTALSNETSVDFCLVVSIGSLLSSLLAIFKRSFITLS
jgi:hypothetical protein